MRSFLRIVDRLFLLVAKVMPPRVAAHCLNLLRQDSAAADRWGYHIRPIHYYEPLPDFRVIKAEQLKVRRIPKGVRFDMAAQALAIEDLATRFGEELRDRDATGAFPFRNEYFAGHDAA